MWDDETLTVDILEVSDINSECAGLKAHFSMASGTTAKRAASKAYSPDLRPRRLQIYCLLFLSKAKLPRPRIPKVAGSGIAW